MPLIGILVVLIVILVIYWAGHRLAAAFGAPAQIMVIFDVILVLLAVLYALQAFGLLPHMR